MIKSAVIKAANKICKVYYSSSKKTEELLTSCSQKLLSLANDLVSKAQLKHVHKEKLAMQYNKLKSTKIMEQVELNAQTILDRIVSYYEDHARPLPKGKISGTEFGVKLRLDMSANGTNYATYLGNPSEAGMLQEAVLQHKEEFGKEFKKGTADRGFYNEKLT